jgi:hypothetical protein
MITASLIAAIKERASTVPNIKQVLMHPEGADRAEMVEGTLRYTGTRLTEYPAAVFVKDSVTNKISENASNFRVVTFRGWVIVPCNNIESADVWERILPDAVDALMEAFDVNWDFGTVDGRRIWAAMESGIQGYTPESDGRVAWEEVSLVLKFSVPTA